MPELTVPSKVSLIDLSSSESGSDDPSDSDDNAAEIDGSATNVNKGLKKKKKKKEIDESLANVVLPLGFLDPLPPKERGLLSSAPVALAAPAPNPSKEHAALSVDNNSRKFSKAGDYEGASSEEFLHYPSQTPKSANTQSVSSGKAQSLENKFSLRSKSLEKSSRNGCLQNKVSNKISGKRTSSSETSAPSVEDVSDDIVPATNKRIHESRYLQKSLASKRLCGKDGSQAFHSSPESRCTEVQQNSSKNGKHLILDNQRDEVTENDLSYGLDQLKEENHILKDRLKRKEEEILGQLLKDLNDKKAKCKLVEAQVEVEIPQASYLSLKMPTYILAQSVAGKGVKFLPCAAVITMHDGTSGAISRRSSRSSGGSTSMDMSAEWELKTLALGGPTNLDLLVGFRGHVAW